MRGARRPRRPRARAQEGALELLRALLDPEAAGAPGGAAAPSALGLIVDLLCFCVQHHGFRIKYYVLRNRVVEAVLALLGRREKWLGVAAVRFLRACVGLKDEFYNRYLVRNGLLEPVVAAFLANGRRYNLLNSAVLELLDFVRRENVRGLVAHVVDAFAPRLAASVDYCDTVAQLRARHEQNQERGGAPDAPAGPAAQAAGLEAARVRRDERSLDKGASSPRARWV